MCIVYRMYVVQKEHEPNGRVRKNCVIALVRCTIEIQQEELGKKVCTRTT